MKPGFRFLVVSRRIGSRDASLEIDSYRPIRTTYADQNILS